VTKILSDGKLCLAKKFCPSIFRLDKSDEIR